MSPCGTVITTPANKDNSCVGKLSARHSIWSYHIPRAYLGYLVILHTLANSHAKLPFVYDTRDLLSSSNFNIEITKWRRVEVSNPHAFTCTCFQGTVSEAADKHGVLEQRTTKLHYTPVSFYIWNIKDGCF